MRLLRIENVDLNLFEFDWDLTWAAFFMSPEGKIYARYGGRDAKSADSRNSLEGLRFTMESVLEEHGRNRSAKREDGGSKPLYIKTMPAAKNYTGCIHCHQVKEILRQDAINAGTWNRESIYGYPLPENIGITLDSVRGNEVRAVEANSLAFQAGLKPGDIVQAIGATRVQSPPAACVALMTVCAAVK